MPLTHRLLRKILRPLVWVYYRYLYGGESWLARKLAAVTMHWEQASDRGDTPLSSSEWDVQYSRGRWSFLADPQEAARYGAIAGLVGSRGGPSSVLDVGCGEGILRFYLGGEGELDYHGLDISQAAMDRARQRARAGDCFERADAETFLAQRRYAAVVLNESLYYFRAPLEQARRYFAMVAPGGVMVVSMFESSRTLAILRQLERELPVLDALRLSGQRGAWRLMAFAAESS